MALKAVLASIEGISEELKKLYKENNGKFILDVEEVEGFNLEDVRGLRTSLSKEREASRGLKEKLKSFEELNLDDARDALAKVDEWKKSPPEKKAEAQFKVLEEKLQKEHKKKIDELEINSKDLEDQISELLIDAGGVRAVSGKGGSVDLLLPILSSKVGIRKNPDTRRREVYIKDSDGTPRLSTGGKPMTLEELVGELEKDDRFAGAFPKTGSNGTGATPNSGSGNSRIGVINAADAKDPRKYQAAKTEAIKAGKELSIIG